ncbi:MAG: DNA repair protein RadC [Muribaculaceae bacterium]|nr:DNA repair protein RadC [Muribaculaceae bacterium]
MIVKEIDAPFADGSDDGDNRRAYHYLPIKDMDKEDTPREKAEKFGCGVLSVAELWALILRTGTVGMPITQLCRELMQNNDNRLTTLERRDRKELLEIKGLGRTKAIQIEAVMEIIRRYNREGLGDKPTIRCSADIYELMHTIIGNKPHEEIWALMLNRRNQVVKRYQASRGGTNATVFDTKMVLKEAILENASSLILCHNHPSGNINPSPQDDQITQQCKTACQAMDIRMLDHVIVTANGYYSYNDQNKL